MKAQRIRKGLWLSSLVLGAGVAALGAMYALQKPAEAQGLVAKGKAAVEEYRGRQPKPVLVPPVKQVDLETYVRKPEWKGARGETRYYPFAGPKVPSPELAKPPEETKVEGPKDLEAIGHVQFVIFVPPVKGQTTAASATVFFEFNGDKPLRRAFNPGDWLRPYEKDAERFLLVDIIPEGTKYRVLYEVREPGADVAKARRAELTWESEPPLDQKIRDIVKSGAEAATPKPGGSGGAAPGPAPAGGAAAGGKGTAVTVVGPEAPTAAADWGPAVTSVSANEKHFDFTDETVKRFTGKKPEEVFNDVLKNVRTESYDKGGVKGIAVFPAENDEMAQKFDVRRGDVLVSINGNPVKSKDDAISIAKRLPADTTRVTAVIERNGRQITYVVDPRDPKTRRAAAGLGTK